MKAVAMGASAFVLLMAAGTAVAQISSINALNFNAYENFRNPGSVLPSNLSLNGTAIPNAYNQNVPTSLGGNHVVREVYAQGTGGFANRHVAWFSNDGGNSPYALQDGESFRASACFTIDLPSGYPSGIGASHNSETGFWINNPRVNEQGVSFIDEGGVWLITNGTSFSGGAGMDFNLFGEGGFPNPNSPPIVFPGDTIEVAYEYFYPQAPGARARYRATVNNITRGIFMDSGYKNFNPIPGSNEVGLNPGATFGFRVQNQIFPLIETDISTNIFNVNIVPAPGAAALLGLGGLVALRRRR
ncbi:MAG: hypothetical protein SFY69_02645 [Planctomycetota bacterium]|nr:hypothetical protein [Planctomycetota bacterium]